VPIGKVIFEVGGGVRAELAESGSLASLSPFSSSLADSTQAGIGQAVGRFRVHYEGGPRHDGLPPRPASAYSLASLRSDARSGSITHPTGIL
jgi:hypothetical protein